MAFQTPLTARTSPLIHLNSTDMPCALEYLLDNLRTLAVDEVYPERSLADSMALWNPGTACTSSFRSAVLDNDLEFCIQGIYYDSGRIAELVC